MWGVRESAREGKRRCGEKCEGGERRCGGDGKRGEGIEVGEICVECSKVWGR